MNPNMELEELLEESIISYFGEEKEELAQWLYGDIRDWMNRNQIIFYQP